MTQKAQLQKYKDKPKPEDGPSTPVIITGGGPSEVPGGALCQSVTIASDEALPFKVAEAGTTTKSWVASESRWPGKIMEVTVEGQPVRGLSHPAVITFRNPDGQLLLMITEAHVEQGWQLTMSAFEGSFDVIVPGNEPSTWIKSNIMSQTTYHTLTVCDAPAQTLKPGINVVVQFSKS